MYESPIMLLKTDPLIQRVKDETDTMIFQAVARVGVHVDKDELIKALEYDRGQYEKGFHDGRMYVPPCPSNADLLRSMSDEEFATEICKHDGCPFREAEDDECLKHHYDCKACWLDWLRQEAEHGCAD